MAIYHQHIKVFQRSKGHNIVNAIAYRRGIKLIDPKSGKAYDYSYRKDVVYSEILLPENAPQWIKEIVELDKTDPLTAAKRFGYSIELRERRKDSQLARETEVALPRELNQAQNLALCQEFAKFFTDRGMVVEIDIHDAHKGQKNPHVHILLSMRELTDQGWGDKVRSWNGRALGQMMRLVWEEVQNKHLALAGFAIKVSRLSNATRGIDLEPTVHEGNQNNLANQQARERNAKIRLRNLEKIRLDPVVLLEALSQQAPTFNVQDIAQTLGTQLESANETPSLMPEPPKPRRVVSRVSQFISAIAPQLFVKPEPTSATAALGVVESPPSPAFDLNLQPTEIIEQVLTEITQHESVFNEQFLTRTLSRYVTQPEVLAQVLLQIKTSPELLAIGPGEDGRERYTTREMFDLENNIQELAEQLNQKAKHNVNGHMINKYIKKFNIDSDQAQAIRHILKGNDITVMVGRAGTGKSYSLKTAKAAWEASDYQVQGIALAGKAADSLENDSGIASRTIESFCTALNSEKLVLTAKDIIVMDEAGMTDSLSMSKVLIAVVKSGAKLVLVGDHAQLQPVGPGAIFRALLERLGFAELTTIRRQKEVWQKEATGHFAAGRTIKALEYYERHDCISLSDTPALAKESLIQDWASAIKTSPLSENLILAYENAQVTELNKLARYHLNAEGALSNPAITHNAAGEIGIAHGERILFLENKWRYGVKNGQLGTIIGHSCDADAIINGITVLLDGPQEKTITFDPNKYKKFAYGYAVTIHRSQGSTVDNVFALASKGWNRHLSYVAMTRHRLLAKLYDDKETHKTFSELKKNLAKIGTKDSTLDYPLAFAARRGIDTGETTNRFQKHIFEKLKKIKVDLKNGFEQTFRPKQYWERQAEDADKHVQIEALLTRREDAKRVAAYVDANCETGKAGADLQALGIKNPTKEERVFLNNHPLSKAFSLAVIKRNEIAAEIYTAPERYSQALEIYGISLEKLAKQSQDYELRQRVIQYLEEVKRGRVVHRDRLAFIIQSGMKVHYPALMAEGVPLEALKVQANAHERREIFRNSSSIEREAFREVESYIKLSREGGRLWHQIITKEKALKTTALISVNDLTAYQISRLQALAKSGVPIPREWLVKAAAITQQRDSLAASIIQNRNHYQKALDFYEFGSLKTNSEVASAFEIQANQYAKERLEKLEKQANLFLSKKADQQFVQDYIEALNGQAEGRFAMAAAIMKDKLRYYRIIYDIYDTPSALFRFIGQDAKTYTRNAFLEGLSADAQEKFLTVEQFLQANRTSAAIWYETKEILDPQPAILKEIATPHIVSRDALANAILSEPESYRAALEYFNLKPEHLSKKAFYHQVREDLTAFKKCVGNLESRTELALKLVRNREAYVVIKDDALVSWCQLQRYADYARKIEYIASLTSNEKADYFSAMKYKRLRREAGKSWSYIFSQRKVGREVERDLFSKAIAINRERNELAFTIKKEYDRFDDFLFLNQVQTKDIDKHADAHAESLKNQKAIASLHANQLQNQTKDLSIPPLKNSDNSCLNTIVAKLNSKKIAIPFWDAHTVSEALLFNASAFVESLLGHPNQKLSDSKRLRYGKNGSLSVNIDGHYAGTWKDFESDEKGNFFGLIQRELQMDFKQAVQYAAEWAGVSPETKLLKQNKKIRPQSYLQANGFTPEQLKKIKYARKIVSESVPITGTIAESYLKTHRGISGTILDKSFRFSDSIWEPETQKKCPALLVIARDATEEVQAVQCIYLNPNTHDKMNIAVKKRTYGPLQGATVLIQAATSVPNVGRQYALAEGPETALSIAEADPNLGVFATLGISNFAKTPIPLDAKNILICADNDGIEAASHKALNKAIHSLSERGFDAYVVKPIQCKDFNDVLKKQGAAEVKNLLETKTLAKEALTLEQLIENKESLISADAKIIVEFSENYTNLQKLKEPQTLEEFELKAQLSQRTGELALHIKNNPILMEGVKRRSIQSHVQSENHRYETYKEKQNEAQFLLRELNSKDLIADYMNATQRKAELTPPWINKIETEKEEWRTLNDRIQKLAFVIDNDPKLCYKAKDFGISKFVSADAQSYQQVKVRDKEMSMDMGL